MLIPVVPTYRTRRGRSRPTRVPPTPPPAGLVVSGVVVQFFDGADGSVRVQFNTTPDDPLVDNPFADAGKWTARYDGVLYGGSFLMLAEYNEWQLNLTAIGGQVGANVIGYSNAPSDISDALGRELAAFSGFAL